MAYLLHPEKVDAVNSVLLKRKARAQATGKGQKKPGQSAGTPSDAGGLVTRLAQKLYNERQRKTRGTL